ncbi:MAG TPA: secretin N-terminal domain-containing protein [Candidatus Rubrimentiphilum sp.]|nr:secretin N-terminal domain-containing protein [Candidatus Rubrimentiphilum sp.]
MKVALVAITLCLMVSATTLAETRITLDVRDASLADVFSLLAVQTGVNIVLDDSIKDERVSLHLERVTLHDALEVLTQTHGLAERRVGSIVIVGTAETINRRFGLRTTAFPLAHADPVETAKQLQTALEPGTLVLADAHAARVIVSGSPQTVDRAQRLVRTIDAGRLGDRQRVHVYRLRYARPNDVAGVLKASFPDDGFTADDAQNAIVASAGPDSWKLIAVFLEALDTPSPQVLFEVRVADVRPIDEQSDVGLQFGGYDLSGQPISGSATYAFARNSLAVNARLNALISSGHARILATPKLLTLNNHEADMLIGETYPVVYYDARLGGQQVQFVDIGVKLRLTPTIGRDGSITAEMHPEYSAIEGFVGGYPIIANRRVDSTLRVRDSETIVLGGLLRDIDSETITKVPGLSAIPILGKLFEDRLRSHQRDEVIFLITPHVIPSR